MGHAQVFSVAKTAAEQATAVLLEYFGKAGIQQKSSRNLVTEADFQAESTIKKCIADVYPNHQILGEEGGATGGNDTDSLWIVDPLDGTNNYAHGIPQFSTSIAYAFKGEIQVGIIIDPMRQETFSAIKGEGACLNGNRIKTSERSTLDDSIVATGFFYDRGEMMERTLNSMHRLFAANIRGIRRFGSAALDLVWVACGRLEGFYEYQLSPWDYAAGMLINTEAGGHCFDRDGKPMTLDSGNTISTNGKISEAMLEQVRWDHAASSPERR